jgi:hypothetical protein
LLVKRKNLFQQTLGERRLILFYMGQKVRVSRFASRGVALRLLSSRHFACNFEYIYLSAACVACVRRVDSSFAVCSIIMCRERCRCRIVFLFLKKARERVIDFMGAKQAAGAHTVAACLSQFRHWPPAHQWRLSQQCVRRPPPSPPPPSDIVVNTLCMLTSLQRGGGALGNFY